MKHLRRRMLFILVSGILLLSNQSQALQLQNEAMIVTDLKVEYATNPLGIDDPEPRLFWKLVNDSGISKQTAYQVRVAEHLEALKNGENLVWDSQKLLSEENTHVRYEGPDLQAGKRFYWQVRVWNQDDNVSRWSDASWWEMGKLNPSDWQARWIGGRQELDHNWANLTVSFDFTLFESSAMPYEPPSFPGAPQVQTEGPDHEITPIHFLFRAQPMGKSYGETYLWQVTSIDGQPMLRALSRHYPGGNNSETETKVIKEFPLNNISADQIIGKRHNLAIEVNGSQITTWFNGNELGTVNDDSHQSGTIGIEALRGDAASIHKVSVEVSGNEVFYTDFSNNYNPFTVGNPTDEGLLLTGDAGTAGKPATLPITTPAPLMRKEFNVMGDIAQARLYAAAGGFPRMILNGQQIGNPLENGFTDYNKRVLYRTYDVTDLLNESKNALAVELGRGWYGVTVPNEWYFHMAGWHGQPTFLAQLEITYEDGSVQVVKTDGTWKTKDGPTTYDSIYLGEKYDARLEPEGWGTADFDDSIWSDVAVVEGPKGRLVAAELEPIRSVDTLRVKNITNPKEGIYVFDFGRIFAGNLQLNASGSAGQTVSMVQSEKLNEDGTVQVISGLIDGQLQTDYYTFSGEGNEQWQPSFSYKGFRYVQVEGYPGELTRDDLIGKVIHSSVNSIGSFSSSDTLLNKIQQAARYTLLNNTHGFITDTPTYEKNGWTGDANASSLATALNFNMGLVWTKWLADFRDAQSPQGEMPVIVPTTSYYGYENTPGWNMVWGSIPSWDAATSVIPWDQYQVYGDKRILEEMYETQKRLVDYTSTYFTGDNGFRYGNSNNLFLGEYAAAGPNGPLDATATAYYYHMVDLLARSAGILQNQEDEKHYKALAEEIRKAYNERYLGAEKMYYRTLNDAGEAQPYSQTQNILPIAFGLVPEGEDAIVMQKLVSDIKAEKYHLTAGIFGTRYLMNLLSDFGYTDTAYMVATQTDEPSWGWWIANDHLTMMEGWSLNSRSFDHHYYASISSWFYQSLAGIRPAAPGYRKLIIKPHIPKGLKNAGATINTMQGEVTSEWEVSDDGVLNLQIVVPGNTVATVYVPSGGERPQFNTSSSSSFKRFEEGYAVYTLGPGSYTFISNLD